MGNFPRFTSRTVSLTQNAWTRLTAQTTLSVFRVQNNTGSAINIAYTQFPWALSLNGTDTSVNADGLESDADFAAGAKGSIAAKVLLDSGGSGARTLFSVNDTNASEYLYLRFDTNDKLTAKLRTATEIKWEITADNAVATDEYNKVKLVHNGVEPVLYVNGEQVPITQNNSTDLTAWISVLSNLDNTRIGCDSFNSGGNSNFFQGDLAELQIYDDLKIQPGGNRVRIAEYLCNDGSGTTLSDATGNYDGTISNQTWADREPGFVVGDGHEEYVANPDFVPPGPVHAYTTASGTSVTVGTA